MRTPRINISSMKPIRLNTASGIRSNGLSIQIINIITHKLIITFITKNLNPSLVQIQANILFIKNGACRMICQILKMSHFTQKSHRSILRKEEIIPSNFIQVPLKFLLVFMYPLCKVREKKIYFRSAKRAENRLLKYICYIL